MAPASWLIQRDVDEGRAKLNFSEWQTRRGEGEETGELVEVIREGEMPPRSYLLLHPDAMLTDSEKRQLADGLASTAGNAVLERNNGEKTEFAEDD